MSPFIPPVSRRTSKAVRHLSQHDVAERWRMSVRTLERWRSLRQGPPFLKLGGRVVYRIEDIEAFEAKRLKEHCAA